MGSGALHVRRVPPKATQKFENKNNHIDSIIDHHPTLSRADFADTAQIEDLLAWTHPHLGSPPGAPSQVVVFTEAENAAMLRLPRKECSYLSISFFFSENKQLSGRVSPTIKTSPPPKKRTTST